MGDSFKKVKAGDRLKIPAAAHNAFIDAAQAVRRGQHDQGQDVRPGHRSSGIVLVKNTSGAARERFDVLGIHGIVIDPTDNLPEFQDRPVLIGTLPATTAGYSHQGRFVILLEPLANNTIGRAVASGICVARVFSETGDEKLVSADIKFGDSSCLQSFAPGSATILWREEGAGTKWAVVRLGEYQIYTFWARITGYQGGGDDRWHYGYIEVVKTGTGYGGWSEKPGGYEGYPAYNAVEDGGLATKPCPVGTIVKMEIVVFWAYDCRQTELWFSCGTAW